MKAPPISLTWYLVLCFSCLVWAGVGLMSSQSFGATEANQGGDIKYPNIGSDGSSGTCESRHQGKLLAVIVPCIRDIVMEATTKMTDEFDEYLKAPAFAFMTLVVTLFGIKMLTNEGDLKKQGVLLLFKIAAVMLFMDNFGGFIPAVFGAIKDASDMVTTSLSGVSSTYQCNVAAYQGEKPWNYMDCILGELFGFGADKLVGDSTFGFVGPSVWSGQFGPVLALGGAAAMIFVLRLIIYATYVYLMALVIVGFLIIMSPLLIPLLMLARTHEFYEKWLKALISTMIQPVMVLAYLSLCFSILDKMMYDEELGLAKNLTKEDIQNAQNVKSGADNVGSNNDPVAFARRAGMDPKFIANATGLNPADPKDVASTMNLKDLYSVDFRSDRASKTQKVMFSMAALVIVAWMLDAMLKEILTIAQQLLGGGYALKGATDNNPLEDGLQAGVNSATSGNPSQIVSNAIKGMVNGR